MRKYCPKRKRMISKRSAITRMFKKYSFVLF